MNKAVVLFGLLIKTLSEPSHGIKATLPSFILVKVTGGHIQIYGWLGEVVFTTNLSNDHCLHTI